MNKISRKLLTLCLVCIMAVGICGTAYAGQTSTFANDSKSGVIPSSGSVTWDQPDGYKAFRVSIRNDGSRDLSVTVVYPGKAGSSSPVVVAPGKETIILTDNAAPAGRYELDFNDPHGQPSGRYGIRWSTESL